MIGSILLLAMLQAPRADAVRPPEFPAAVTGAAVAP